MRRIAAVFCTIGYVGAIKFERRAPKGAVQRRGTLSFRHGLCREYLKEFGVDDSTKREIWILTLSTLAAVPVVATLAMAVVSGIVTW